MNISISVIIPCYNSSKTIRNCIKSIIEQSEPVDEIIIVDDGSTDQTLNIIYDIMINFENQVKFIIFEQNNSGPSIARNKGIQLSNCNYIAFLDSDDEWLIDHIKNIKKFLSKNIDYKIVATKYLSAPFTYTGEILFDKLLYRNYFLTPCTVISKNIFSTCHYHYFKEEMKYAEDYYLWLNIIHKNKGFVIDYIGAKNIINKMPFGDKGLSKNLKAMHNGVLFCYEQLYENKIINYKKFVFVKIFEKIKYLRRYILTLIKIS